MYRLNFKYCFVLILISFLSGINCYFAFSQGSNKNANALNFVENKGQWNRQVIYKAGKTGHQIYFEKDGWKILEINSDTKHLHPHNDFHVGDTIKGHVLKLNFLNTSSNCVLKADQKEPYYYNYFTGKDSTTWATNVGVFKSIKYESIYNGIDIVVHFNGQDLQHDYYVQPNANPSVISFQILGNEGLTINANGALEITTSLGVVKQLAPYAFQRNSKGKLTQIKVAYKKNEDGSVGFSVGKYDHKQLLIIDPTLIFCTYTGSTDDNWGTSATYDNNGNLYAAGIVVGNGYPTTVGAFQTLYGGGTGTNAATWNPYYGDISISKFNAFGTGLIYSSFLGGSNNDYPNSLIVTNNNELIVFGRSYSSDYPTTVGCYDNTHGGNADMVITKFNAAGSGLIGSTYVGGSLNDGVNYSDNENVLGSLKRNYGDDARGEVNIATDGTIFIASCTYSSDFPTTPGCFQSTFGGGLEDGVLLKLNWNLSALLFSTYIGGSANDACFSLDIDQSNNSIFVTGGTESANFPTTVGVIHPNYLGAIDGFLLHMNSTGSALLASTYIGTTLYDQSYFVKLDKNQVPYIMGQTTGSSFPVSAGVYSNPNSGQFVAKINSNLTSILKSTVIGNGNGLPNLSPTAFTVDICDNVYLAGWGGYFLGMGPGSLASMPLTPNALQSTTDQATQSDFYLAVLNRNFSSLTFGSYYGGNGSLEHVDGGTSRFDKNGYIYGAICAGCIYNDSYLQATSGAYSSTNSSNNCNLAAYKIHIPFPYLMANANAVPDTFGCGPFTVQFQQTTSAQHYSWDFGDPSSGALNYSIFQNPVHTFNNPGTYQIMSVIIDSNFCNITDTVYLHVIVTNDTIQSSIGVSDTLVCPNQIVSFTANATFGQTYQWYFGDNTSSTSANPTHAYSNTGYYNVMLIVSNPLTCNKKDTAFLPIHVAMLTVKDSFTVNTNHGCPPLNVHFTSYLPNATSYYWNFGDGSPLLFNTPNPTHTFNTVGVFTVQLFAFNPNLCITTDTFAVAISVSSTQVQAQAQAISSIGCVPYNASFQNSSANASSYWWSFGDPSSGTFNTSVLTNPSHIYNAPNTYQVTLVAIDTFTCNKYDTIHFNVVVDTNAVIAAFTANPITGCYPLNVNVNNNSWHATSYLWSFGDGTFSSLSNPPAHLYNDTSHYVIQLIASDSSTCNKHDTSSILIDPYYTEVIAAFVPSDTLQCGTLNLNLTNLSQNASNYNWDLGDATTSTLFQPSHTYFLPGNYLVSLVAENTNLCKTRDTAIHWLHVFQQPVANFTTIPFTWKPDSLFQFPNSSLYADHYTWIVDGIVYSNNQDASAAFHKLGYHTICLIASTNAGCSDSLCRQVYVDVIPSIGVPNAFSPDGDGVNDFLFVYGLGIETLNFKVYNRWGQLVFETNDRNRGWDGTFKGVPQEMDAYAWIATATFITGTSKTLKGNVTLVR